MEIRCPRPNMCWRVAGTARIIERPEEIWLRIGAVGIDEKVGETNGSFG